MIKDKFSQMLPTGLTAKDLGPGDLLVQHLSKILSPQDQPMSFQNLQEKQGEKKILLEDVSFYLPGGSLLAILGRSGSGKSVLLKSLLNLFPPRQGEVFFRPKNKSSHDSQDQEEPKESDDFHKQYSDLNLLYSLSGVVFQSYGLFESLSVGENILFPLLHEKNQQHPWKSLFFGSSYDIKNFQSLGEMSLKNVGLSPDIFSSPVSSLSGGMKRRVAIARALLKKPHFLFFDEPTEGLDPLTSRDITHLIKTLHYQEKTTTLIITHDPQQAFYLADYIGFMDKGKLVFFNKKEFLDKEAPYYVKEFLSCGY